MLKTLKLAQLITVLSSAFGQPPGRHLWMVLKGKVGSWTEYFEGARLDEFNKWIEDNLRGTDITIPFK